jgi:hypothetical protein
VLCWPEPVAIGGPEWPEFSEALSAAHVGLVVFDTQAAMTVGRKENDNDDAAEIISYLSAMAMTTGACVLLIHHQGWADDGRARGASATYAGLDTELQLAEGRADREVQLIQRKQRYIERGKPTRLKLLPHEGQLVVAPVGADGVDADAFLNADRDARAQALAERLVAYEESGGSLPPKLGVRDIERVIRDEMGLAVDRNVALEAARMLKRQKGIRL